MEEKIEIPLSKIKIGLLLLVAMLFVLMGILFITNPEGWSRPPGFIRIIGVISVIFFGFLGIYSGRKLFDNKIGLTIDEEGITDNTHGSSVGLIAWEDIRGVRKLEIASTKMLLILTDQPNKYIERGKNRLVRQTMKVNHKSYESPIWIISHSLKIKFADLEKLILEEWEKRENRKTS